MKPGTHYNLSGLADKRVLVCGGRDYANTDRVGEWLTALQPSEVCEGGSGNVDILAYEWAKDNCVPCTEFEADWKAAGKAAGPIRNKRMADEWKPDLVLAFPGGRGTANMVRYALSIGIPVLEVD